MSEDTKQTRTIGFTVPKEHSGHTLRVAAVGRGDGVVEDASAYCVTCDAPIPQSDPEPTEPPEPKVPTSETLAQGLCEMADWPALSEVAYAIAGMNPAALLKAAAWRLTNSVLVVDSDETIAKAIEDATGVPVFCVPRGTEIVEVAPDEKTVAYVLEIAQEGAGLNPPTFEAQIGLQNATGKPVFLAHGLRLEEVNEDSMRRHGWVRTEEKGDGMIDCPDLGQVEDTLVPKPTVARCDRCGQSVVLEDDGRFPLHYHQAPSSGARCGRSFQKPGEDLAHTIRKVIAERQDHEPLEPGVQWEHFCGGLGLRVDDEGKAGLHVSYFASPEHPCLYDLDRSDAERLIDVLSRWLPTQPKWTAPGSVVAENVTVSEDANGLRYSGVAATVLHDDEAGTSRPATQEEREALGMARDDLLTAEAKGTPADVAREVEMNPGKKQGQRPIPTRVGQLGPVAEDPRPTHEFVEGDHLCAYPGCARPRAEHPVPRPGSTICDHCGTPVLLLSDGRLPEHVMRSGNVVEGLLRCPRSGQEPIKAPPGRPG